MKSTTVRRELSDKVVNFCCGRDNCATDHKHCTKGLLF